MNDNDTARREPALAHVVPARLLLAVFAALVVLTALTYAVTYVDLGAANLWLAMAIAAVKGSLVALYFMHLRWDKPLHSVVFLAALFFVAVFIAFALMDTLQYKPDLIPGYQPGMDG